jgi:peptidoglycan lytic transglycosylase
VKAFDRAARRAALVSLAAMTLLACRQSEIVTGPAPAPPDRASLPGEPADSFSSFPASYFASSTFSPSAPSSAALSLAAEPEATGSAGLRLASVTSTPVLIPPDKRVEPKISSYGLASFYRHHTRTASGEKFDERELTAAHRTLPFGTRLRVTSVATGRSVTVRVNDRGPFVQGRVVDLSYSAAQEIGMVGRGVTKVKVDVVQ